MDDLDRILEIETFMLTNTTFITGAGWTKDNAIGRIESADNDFDILNQPGVVHAMMETYGDWKERYVFMTMWYELHALPKVKEAIVRNGFVNGIIGIIDSLEAGKGGDLQLLVYRTNAPLFEKLKEMYTLEK